MRIKSYFAQSVQEAMERARIELGPEAMLMSSKKSGPEQSRLGAYEVVFGVATETRPPPSAAARRPRAQHLRQRRIRMAWYENSRICASRSRHVRRSVSRQGHSRRAGYDTFPEFEELYERLIAADFSDEIAHELVESVATRMPNPQRDASRNILGEKRSLAPELLCGAAARRTRQRLRVRPNWGCPA